MTAMTEIKKKDFFTKEPIVHSHITDCLPEDHPLAYECVYCHECDVTLHASNNECMQTWYETEFGNFCTACFKLVDAIDELEDVVIKKPKLRETYD